MKLKCITKHGYQEVGKIIVNNGTLEFSRNTDKLDSNVMDNACTYLWVQKSDDCCHEVMYVGLAGKGLNKRWRQQENDFNKAK